MKPQTLVDELNALIAQALARWGKAVPGIEADLYERVLQMAGQFEAKDGAIRPSTQNLRLLRSVRNDLDALLNQTDYPAQVGKLLADFSTSAQFMGEYFSSFVKNFNSTQTVLGLVKETSISATVNSLQGAGISQQLLTPIEAILRDNITVGGKLADFRKQLRGFIQGTPTVPSRLNSYVGQITTDALNQYGRAYLETVTNEVGLQFCLYEGGTKTTSRQFCRDRAGHFFHRKEVEAWAGLNWSGKIPGTNAATIFVYCGGYHCYHFLIPVAVEAVPAAVVARAKAAGHYAEEQLAVAE